MQLGGRPIVALQNYRVGVQSYLGTGGDNFNVFTQGRDVTGGGLDVDALADYLRASFGFISKPVGVGVSDNDSCAFIRCTTPRGDT